jgi:hypothetical protein
MAADPSAGAGGENFPKEPTGVRAALVNDVLHAEIISYEHPGFRSQEGGRRPGG